jgi:DNA-directed RNA polymerase subunit RPC12/RpoP
MKAIASFLFFAFFIARSIVLFLGSRISLGGRREMNEKEVMRCPKCNTRLIVKDGRKGEAKAIAKSLLTSRIERAYFCPRCGYTEKGQTIIQK